MLLPHCTGSYLGWDTQLGYSTRATLLYSTGLDGLDGRKGRRVVVDELSSVSLTSATCSKNIVYKEISHSCIMTSSHLLIVLVGIHYIRNYVIRDRNQMCTSAR